MTQPAEKKGPPEALTIPAPMQIRIPLSERLSLHSSTEWGLYVTKYFPKERIKDGIVELFCMKRLAGGAIQPVLAYRHDEYGLEIDMPYCHMGSTAEVFKCVTPGEDTMRQWIISGLLALVRCHEAGIKHCDIKPHNFLVTADGLRLIDFELARTGNSSANAYTEYFRPPEAWQGKELHVTSDIWAFGATVYCWLYGKYLPRQQKGAEAIHIPSGPFATMLSSMLCQDPEDRYSAREILALFKEVKLETKENVVNVENVTKATKYKSASEWISNLLEVQGTEDTPTKIPEDVWLYLD